MMKKRIICLLLSLSMLVSIIPTALADEIESDNLMKSYGSNIEQCDEVSALEIAPETSNKEVIFLEENTEIVEEEITPKIEQKETPVIELDNTDEIIESSIQLAATGIYYPEYKFYFDTSNGTITDADENISGSLNIPETIGGISVTQISNNAFQNCKDLTEGGCGHILGLFYTTNPSLCLYSNGLI